MAASRSTFRLNQFLPFRLLNASENVSLKFSERYKRIYGMTRPEWRVFAILGEHKQSTATDVGSISRMHKTKVSRAVSSLASRGWVARKRDTNDRRIEHLELTAQGKVHHKKMVAEAIAFEKAIAAKLGADSMAVVWQAIEYLDELERE